MSAQWLRNTPWHQGAILPDKAVSALLSAAATPEQACVLVISHDCDLANDDLGQEPDVEVIIGRRLSTGKGNFYWAKSPRTLHLDARCNGEDVVIELVATARRTIPKQDLASFRPCQEWALPGDALNALRSWLAVRYNRSAWPDAFVDRLNASKLGEKLATLMKKEGQHVSAVYFNLDGGRRRDHTDGSAYELDIVFTFLPGNDPVAMQARMDDLADRVTDAFTNRLFDPGTEAWKDIVLKGCMAISEDDMTLSQARKLQTWRLDHLSVRGGDGHAMPIV